MAGLNANGPTCHNAGLNAQFKTVSLEYPLNGIGRNKKLSGFSSGRALIYNLSKSVYLLL
jgi:hypothetical protein